MVNKYTNKEYIKMYDNYLGLCSNVVSQITKYDGWSGDTRRSEATKLYDLIVKEFEGIDFTVFSTDELKKLGFKEWDEEVILAPIWALDCLTEGTKIVSMNGDEITVGEYNLDTDVRMGVTAYGFHKTQLRSAKIEQVLED